MSKPSPCFGCEEHSTYCHSECEVYKAWLEEREKKKNDIYKARDAERPVYGYIKERGRRRKK